MLPKKVLFLCIGNACRSQMAESIARHLAADVIKPTSAGLFPFGSIPASTTAVLAEKNMNCDGQTSKPLLDADLLAADLIVNMTGRPREHLFDDETLPVEDWDVGDPFGSDLDVYRRIRDEVERRVLGLAARLRAWDRGAKDTAAKDAASKRAASPGATPRASRETQSSKEADCPAKPPAYRAKIT